MPRDTADERRGSFYTPRRYLFRGRVGPQVSAVRLLRALVLAAIACLTCPKTADARSLQLTDLRSEVAFFDPTSAPDLSAPAISPNGKHIACIQSKSNFSNDTSDDRVVLIDTTTGRTRDLVRGLNGVNQLRWIPHSQRLSFLARKSSGDALQVFWVSTGGGQLVELTRAPGGVEDYAWRPDGMVLAFSTPDAAPPAHGFPHVFEVHDNDYRATEAETPSHLWILSAPSGTPHRLTSGSWSIPKRQPILPQHFPSDFFSWSADGARIVFTKAPDAYTADDDGAVIALLNLSDGAVRKLTTHRGLESGGAFSPDGAHVAYWYPKAGNPIGGSEIFVSSPAGGDGIDVTRNLDRSPWLVQWFPDSRSLLVLAHDGTQESMWTVNLNGVVQKLDVGTLSVSAASISTNGAIALVASGPQTPSELYYLPSARARPHRLTHVNKFLSSLELGKVRGIQWRGPDGFTEDGVLTYPPHFSAGKRYPLVLQIHGWPAYASQQAFDTDYPGLTQLFAAHGYVVFEPNYRGSDNLGNTYETAIFNDAGNGPGRDIMAGIAAVEKLGIVDEQRIAVSGWSYGGFMTAWLISHYKGWSAAIVGAAPTDGPADYAISDYNVLDRLYFGTSPWASRAQWQRYMDQSIMPYAWNIRTPTLILCDTGDVTVPITHSYELYHALRDRGVPVTFIAFESNDHYPTDPVTSEEVYRRWVGWLDRYLQ